LNTHQNKFNGATTTKNPPSILEPLTNKLESSFRSQNHHHMLNMFTTVNQKKNMLIINLPQSNGTNGMKPQSFLFTTMMKPLNNMFKKNHLPHMLSNHTTTGVNQLNNLFNTNQLKLNTHTTTKNHKSISTLMMNNQNPTNMLPSHHHTSKNTSIGKKRLKNGLCMSQLPLNGLNTIQSPKLMSTGTMNPLELTMLKLKSHLLQSSTTTGASHLNNSLNTNHLQLSFKPMSQNNNSGLTGTNQQLLNSTSTTNRLKNSKKFQSHLHLKNMFTTNPQFKPMCNMFLNKFPGTNGTKPLKPNSTTTMCPQRNSSKNKKSHLHMSNTSNTAKKLRATDCTNQLLLTNKLKIIFNSSTPTYSINHQPQDASSVSQAKAKANKNQKRNQSPPTINNGLPTTKNQLSMFTTMTNPLDNTSPLMNQYLMLTTTIGVNQAKPSFSTNLPKLNGLNTTKNPNNKYLFMTHHLKNTFQFLNHLHTTKNHTTP
jgi:hypothetical protein